MQIAKFDTQHKAKDKVPMTSKITIMLLGGAAFTIKGNSDTIATYIATQGIMAPAATKPEFAGLAADKLPGPVSLAEIDVMEFDAWIAVEEEPRARVNWSNLISKADTAFAATPTDASPFYLDSGATVHISPDPSDFVTLTPIPERPV